MKSPAEHIIETLGGLTKLARELGFPVSTVQGWKERGKIPQEHWQAIIAVAKGQGVDLDFADFVLPVTTEHAAETVTEKALAS